MNFFHTHISPRAIELAAEVLKSTFVSEGRLVRDFEAVLARDWTLANPVAVNSGTSALHLALVVAGVKPGDEVILPSQTFIASGLAILMCGARPVFADIRPDTGNIDPASIKAKLTERTRAVMPVHWAGLPCDLAEIAALADPRGITVIEDAAHAFGAIYQDRPIGTISHLTAFSFQAIKHLTTGDGGALCCLRDADYEKARRLRWFGVDRLRDLPAEHGERVYDLADVGYKYHLNDLAAAVGLGNLGDMSWALSRHRNIAIRYREELSGTSGLTLLLEQRDRVSSHWVFTLLVERRSEFIRALKSRGVPASVVHLGIDHNQIFGGKDMSLIHQRMFDEKQVALPIHVGLSDDDVYTVVEAVRAGW